VSDEPNPLADDVADLQITVLRLTSQLEQLQATVETLREAPPSGASSKNEVTPSPPFIMRLPDDAYQIELAALATWVEHLLIPVYGREVSATAPWCARWWEHPEAVARLHAAWLAWQGLTDPRTGAVTGPSIWHRDHLDPMLAQLRSAQGPFAACTTIPDVDNHTLLPEPGLTACPRPDNVGPPR
jgi:hypothetical protein